MTLHQLLKLHKVWFVIVISDLTRQFQYCRHHNGKAGKPHHQGTTIKRHICSETTTDLRSCISITPS